MDLNENQITLLIIEDEAHNSRMLHDMIEKLRPDWTILAILESVEESILWFKSNKAPALILMDMQLSDGICFTIFEKVKINPSSRIIFTTAYDEYAIRAFKVNSIDYLLKPIEEEELEKAFQKFEQLIENESSPMENIYEYTRLLHSVLSGKKEYRTRFLISGITSYQKLEADEIAYFYSDNKLTFAVDNSGKEYTLDYNLEQLENELNPTHFFRANRKTIVHFNSVKKMSNELGSRLKVELSPLPEFDVIVSRLKATDFKIWMGK